MSWPVLSTVMRGCGSWDITYLIHCLKQWSFQKMQIAKLVFSGLSLSLSILTAIFPGEPRLAGFTEAKDDGSGGDNWSYKSCKAPLKSSPPTNQHPKLTVSWLYVPNTKNCKITSLTSWNNCLTFWLTLTALCETVFMIVCTLFIHICNCSMV